MEAAEALPMESLFRVAVDVAEKIEEATVFDWHPDPTEAFVQLLPAVPVAYIGRTPEKK